MEQMNTKFLPPFCSLIFCQCLLLAQPNWKPDGKGPLMLFVEVTLSLGTKQAQEVENGGKQRIISSVNMSSTVRH